MSNSTKINLLGLLLILLGFHLSSFAQSLSKEVQTAWNKLKNDSTSKQKQLGYIQAFPENGRQFKAVFNPHDFKQLYKDSYQYIETFLSLSKVYPAKVIDKSIDIGRELVWEADATGQIQEGIVELGNENTRLFVNKVKSLTSDQKKHLITFLADVENHKAYTIYQQLIDSLKRINEPELASQFIKARALRMKQRDH